MLIRGWKARIDWNAHGVVHTWLYGKGRIGLDGRVLYNQATRQRGYQQIQARSLNSCAAMVTQGWRRHLCRRHLCSRHSMSREPVLAGCNGLHIMHRVGLAGVVIGRSFLEAATELGLAFLRPMLECGTADGLLSSYMAITVLRHGWVVIPGSSGSS